MWREIKSKCRPQNSKISNNRLHLVMAIIFLLSGALVYKLFSVQIGQFDLYTALASSQHQVYSQLKSDRGRIFLSESINGQEKLYPLATNKDFANIYVVPKEIVNPVEVAEKLYKYFDEPVIAKEKLAMSATSTEYGVASATKEAIISNYLKKLDKPGDPYESLDKKLSIDELIKLYSYLASTASSTINPINLEVRNEQVVYKKSASSTEVFKLLGFGFDLQKFRYYPEKEMGSHLLGFVSYVNDEERGRYGLEEFFNDDLFGKYGSLKSEKAAQSNTVIVNDREYIKPENGSDIILTVDRNVQFVACEKLKEAVKKHGADGGSVIIVNPKTGAIIAMCSVPDFDPNNYKDVGNIRVYNNPAIFDQYEPGSVFKVVTMSIAVDQGRVSPSTTYKDEGRIMINGWPKPISNSDFDTKGAHGIVDMNAVLENSLNTGAIFAMRQAGPKVFADYVKNYGFGEKTGIELGSESSGDINNLLKAKVKEIDAATASFGQGIAVTPLQMIMSYQAIANKGILMKPYIVKTIIRNDGKREEIIPKQIRRVISAKTADTISAMLVNIVEKGHSSKAYIQGYYIGGKTGTAQIATTGGYLKNQYIHTFIGIAPIENPSFVMLTKMDSPKDVTYAEGSVVPLWKDIADFMLKYYEVPKTRK
ncbi:MAG: peptidoglycan D,D-transpeptidase FtsI family protein [Patescibacteria group bacterium]